ncbi:MAG: DUF2480 family protein [Cyclobacteriaceae bacterium]
MEEPIVNRVANSNLETLNLEEYYHLGERVSIDLKNNLFEGLILKEKDFRAFITGHDWSQYQDKNVAIGCSADVVIPTWAYMLLASRLEPYAHLVVFGDLEDLEQALFQQALTGIDLPKYQDAKVIINGCSAVPVPTYAYVEITRLLTPFASSIMYGEPCSTVPIYKKPKT